MSIKLLEKYREIEAIKNKFLKKVENLSEQQLNKIPSDGGWSIGQTLYHCAYAESGTVMVINRNIAENKVSLNTNIASFLRNFLIVVLLKSPFKVKAPKAVSKVPESISFEEIKKYFEKNTDDFKNILDKLPVEIADKLIFKHPIGGLFNIKQTLNFVREHYQHHEKQINALM